MEQARKERSRLISLETRAREIREKWEEHLTHLVEVAPVQISDDGTEGLVIPVRVDKDEAAGQRLVRFLMFNVTFDHFAAEELALGWMKYWEECWKDCEVPANWKGYAKVEVRRILNSLNHITAYDVLRQGCQRQGMGHGEARAKAEATIKTWARQWPDYLERCLIDLVPPTKDEWLLSSALHWAKTNGLEFPTRHLLNVPEAGKE